VISGVFFCIGIPARLVFSQALVRGTVGAAPR
jgi:hypothetical protein